MYSNIGKDIIFIEQVLHREQAARLARFLSAAYIGLGILRAVVLGQSYGSGRCTSLRNSSNGTPTCLDVAESHLLKQAAELCKASRRAPGLCHCRVNILEQMRGPRCKASDLQSISTLQLPIAPILFERITGL